jgi:hypothetical protein
MDQSILHGNCGTIRLMKNYIFPFTFTIFFFSSITGGQKPSSRQPQDYTYGIVKCTHEINHCFLNIHDCIKNHPLTITDYIKNCRIYLARLEKEIENFTEFQNRTLVNVFKQIKKYTTETEYAFIEETIIPHLSNIDKISDLSSSITCRLQHACSELKILSAMAKNPQLEPNKLYEKLNLIHQEYKAIFEREEIKNILQKKEELQKLLYREKYATIATLTKRDKITKIMRILNVVLWIGKIIEWLPFRDAIRKWLLSEDNILVKSLIICFEGKNKYEKVKPYLPLIKDLDKTFSADTICRHMHTTLQTSLCKMFLIFMKNKKKSEPYFNYAENLQTYLYIEFLECLKRSHYRSIEMIAIENNRFSCNDDEKKVIVASPAQNNNQDNNTHKYAIDAVYNVGEYLTSNSLNTICRHAQNKLNSCAEMGKLFFTTFLPWNNSILQDNIMQEVPRVIQKPAIVLPKPTNTITDFLQLHCFFETHFLETGNDLSKDLPEKFQEHKNIFGRMLALHRTLHKEMEDHYKEYRKQISPGGKKIYDFLPKKWNDLILKIEDLQKQLNQKNNKKKTLKAVKNKLKQHIEVYNLVKIHLYNTGGSHYSKTREHFSSIFTLCSQDIEDTKNIIMDKPLLSEYRYMFNPLERKELGFI